MKKNQGLLSKYDTFIFDWDGTLTRMRTLMRINESLKRIIKRWNVNEEIKIIEKDKPLLKEMISIEETKNQTLATFFDIFVIFLKPRLHNDVIALLSMLKKRGKKVALLSNGKGIRLIKELDDLGIRDKFDTVVSAQDIGRIKPDPSGLKFIMRKLHSKPNRTLYIGDMVDDILAADLAKINSCAVSCGFDSNHILKSAKPDYIFNSIEELLKNLN